MSRPEPIPPKPGQESVWDYPRPPRVEPTASQVEIIFGGETIAVTFGALRVLETSHPPVYYLPPGGIIAEALIANGRTSYCEYKGTASYFDVAYKRDRVANAAWTYLNPSPGYEMLAGYVAVYPALMEVCLVDGEMVDGQPGGFYGGWITSKVAGPFKGGPGTEDW